MKDAIFHHINPVVPKSAKLLFHPRIFTPQQIGSECDNLTAPRMLRRELYSRKYHNFKIDGLKKVGLLTSVRCSGFGRWFDDVLQDGHR